MAVRTGEGNEKSIYKWGPITSVSVYRYSKFAESEHKKKSKRESFATKSGRGARLPCCFNSSSCASLVQELSPDQTELLKFVAPKNEKIV